jgi:hypothetical protein
MKKMMMDGPADSMARHSKNLRRMKQNSIAVNWAEISPRSTKEMPASRRHGQRCFLRAKSWQLLAGSTEMRSVARLGSMKPTAAS